MPIVGQFGSLAGLGSLILPGGAFEPIATVTVGSGGASSIEFTSIPGTYQHLQIRFIARTVGTTYTADFLTVTYNASSGGTSYAAHDLSGNGSSASAAAFTSRANMIIQNIPGANATASVFGAAVVDILDYANTSKNKTMRLMSGYDANGNGIISVTSGFRNDTSAVTSLQIAPSATAGNFAQHTTVALFGLRAP